VIQKITFAGKNRAYSGGRCAPRNVNRVPAARIFLLIVPGKNFLNP
jgi:hypothetical protein